MQTNPGKYGHLSTPTQDLLNRAEAALQAVYDERQLAVMPPQRLLNDYAAFLDGYGRAHASLGL
jgi:hypothetical protein